MNQQDQQAIDELFQELYKSAAQAEPRDPEAEARIKRYFEQGPAGLLYHMAQRLLAQHYALQQARAQLADYQQQQHGSSAGFAQPGRRGFGGFGRQAPAYQPPPGAYQQPAAQPSGQGFLAGAGRIALGVGGGILGAEMLSGLLSGHGLFGGDRDDYDRDYDGGDYDRDDGQDYGGQDDFGGQDPGDGGFDDGGWGGGGFDGDQGGW
jgi:hypothetical protein